mgnify:CR=1 FL=1
MTRKTITISENTFHALRDVGTMADTFDSVISRLIAEHRDLDEIIPWAIDILLTRIDQLYASTPTWGESKSAIEKLIEEAPCEEIRTAAKEYLDQLDRDNQAWEGEGA